MSKCFAAPLIESESSVQHRKVCGCEVGLGEHVPAANKELSTFCLEDEHEDATCGGILCLKGPRCVNHRDTYSILSGQAFLQEML